MPRPRRSWRWRAIDKLREQVDLAGVTHLVVASCTGFVAPGIDQIIARRLGLDNVERTLVGFMGCYAAVSALRTAYHIVRSDPKARVLAVTVELCTLHLQERQQLEPLLAMLQFSDGAAAALLSAEPDGLELSHLFSCALEDSAELIQWKIGDTGFEMTLSGEVPGRIQHALADEGVRATLYNGWGADEIDSWAVHAGGRSILDAVEKGLELPQGSLWASREVLAHYGNMSSSTLMFVLAALIGAAGHRQGRGAGLRARPRRRGLPFREGAMTSLSVRSRQAEQMDAPDLDPAVYAAVLADLAKVNRLLMTARPTIGFIRRGAGRADALQTARRRLRPGRHAARHRPLGAAQGDRGRAGRHRSQPAQRAGRAGR